MSDFDSREKAFEKKFELDAEMTFKISARAAKLLGLWAAGEMGLSGAAADEYARQAISADMAEPGIADLLRKIEADFTAKSIQHSRQELQRRYDEALHTAESQMKAAG